MNPSNFSHCFSQLKMALWSCNLADQQIEFGDSFTELNLGPISNMTISEFINLFTESDKVWLQDSFELFINQQIPFDIIIRAVNGSWYRFISEEQKVEQRFNGTLQNIDHDQNLNHKINELHFLFDHVEDGAIVLDQHFNISTANHQFLQSSGFSSEDLMSASIFETFEKLGISQQNLDYLNDQFQKHMTFQIQLELFTLNRVRHVFKMRCYFHTNNQLEQPVAILIFKDHTENINLKVHAEKSHRELHHLIEAAKNICIIATDPNGVVEYSNSGLEELIGWSIKDTVGVPYVTFHHPDDQMFGDNQSREDLFFGMIIAEAKRKGYDQKEWNYLHKKGHLIPVLVNITAVKGLDDQIEKYLFLVNDISDMKRTKNFLTQAKTMAESAAKAKSEFLAMMSHEIRTPMNGIMGLTQLLHETELDEEQKEIVTNIIHSSDTLMNVLNDVLEFSKIEAGKMSIEVLPFQPHDVLKRCLQLMQNRAKDKGLTIQYNPQTSITLVIQNDEHRMAQVVNNLLSNAIKFTNKGKVSIITKIEEFNGIHGYKVEVSDTGEGISKNAQKRLFMSFTQADSSITRKYGGTGLGLTICKQLIKLMKGEIGFRSKLDYGTTFWFWLPFEIYSQSNEGTHSHHLSMTPIGFQEQSHFKKSDYQHLKVLVVDDNMINLKVATKSLKGMGIETIDTSINGKDSIEKAKNKKYDFILMDCHLPDISGYDATKIIRENSLCKDIPILALTADVSNHTRKKCLEAGMNDIFLKPFTLNVLRQFIANVIKEPS